MPPIAAKGFAEPPAAELEAETEMDGSIAIMSARISRTGCCDVSVHTNYIGPVEKTAM